MFAVGFEHPDWYNGFEHDPEEAARVRVGLLRELAATGETLVATHLSFPSVYHVAVSGDAFRGLVQKRPISGNRTDRQRSHRFRQVGEDGYALIPGEPRVPQQFQPVGLRLARQQFRRALPHALGAFTPNEPTMVQKELQQSQVILPQMTPQEEIAP